MKRKRWSREYIKGQLLFLSFMLSVTAFVGSFVYQLYGACHWAKENNHKVAQETACRLLIWISTTKG